MVEYSLILTCGFGPAQHGQVCSGVRVPCRIWPCLLDTLYPILKGVGQLLRKLALVCQRAFAIRFFPHVKHHHFVEFWHGTGNRTQAPLSSGFDGVGLDVNCSEEHNCLMSSGLRLWMNLLMSIIEHGLCWMRPPCSSFVILCLAHMRVQALFFLLACVVATGVFGATFRQLHVPTTSNVLSPVICQSQQDHNISSTFWWPYSEAFAHLVR